ncbi:hypothetical protein J0B03_10560 [Alkalibacter rhizosphaerae]|uniref:Uncharacterized protein n=1 Tax=Alkalibacter rhizosphaerae TaxID=2815577 RepID=A0A974XH49_9FIRM|nr:hypothetical protein [Alkalibacter rhizosphaerae]QSX08223.1 hypothetical protein J0B03_10560 [Alkalibacter rhizosphaerae]
MKFKKEHMILVLLLMLSLIVVGCAGQASSSDEGPYIAGIKKWSYNNLENVNNYTVIADVTNLYLDEDGNEIRRNESRGERIIFYDPYRTKVTTLSETEYPTAPSYALHQNGTITNYFYFLQEEKYLVSEITEETYPEPALFDSLYIGNGERTQGILLGMVDYEILEDTDEQVVIKATINPEEVHGAAIEYMYIKSLTQTVYYNKDTQQVIKVEDHQLVNTQELSPNMVIDGKSVYEQDLTIVSEYKNINSSPDFELPKDDEIIS